MLLALASAMPSLFSNEDVANIKNLLFDDETYDISFFLYAVCYYSIFRVGCEHLVPGKVKGFTKQQYIVTLLHQAIILPLCAASWGLGKAADAPALLYLLTGAYLASDSLINYTPLANAVSFVTMSPGVPDFSWGIHVHHAITILLCALGPNLPERAVSEGAICVFLGELGSLWITIALLYPSPAVFVVRFYSFLVSRVCGLALAADMATQIYEDSPYLCGAWSALVVGLALENVRSLALMRRGFAEKEA